MATIETLLEYLAQYGGQIISSNDLHPQWIEQARASNRMYVDDNSLGYVWEPNLEYGLPTNDEELEQFKKWYPLPVPLPESLKEPHFLFKNKEK